MGALLRVVASFAMGLIGRGPAAKIPNGQYNYGGLAGGGKARQDDHDSVGRNLNRMWLGEGFKRFADSLSPQVTQQVGVIAVGMPWTDLNRVYRFAIAVANGIIDQTIAGPTSCRYIDAEINHTDKIIKVTIGYQCSGFIDANLLSKGGDKVMNRYVDPNIQAGPWPAWMQNGENQPKVIVTDRNGTSVIVTGDRFNAEIGGGGNPQNAAQDTQAENLGITYGNSMYGKRDMLLQAPPYADDPCSKVPAPKANTQVYDLLGIT